MADDNSQDASTSKATAESSESTVEVNVKTLDSQIYNFQVEKNMPIPLFKEKIASTIGLPVEQQRLIYRGKVLKDDHCLSEYRVEDGDTLHLVARQPVQSQNSTGTNAGEANTNNGNQGSDAAAGAHRNRFNQVPHSVVLGPFNIGDQVESGIPDISRIVGAVLNTIGIANQMPVGGVTNISSASNASSQVPQGAETGARGVSGRGGPTFPNQPFQSFPQSFQFPLRGAAVPVPSHQSPIPDSLSTLLDFINRMGPVLSVNGDQPPSATAGDPPRTESSSSVRGPPTPEALAAVIRRAEELLRVHTVAALSHIAGRLEGEGGSTDPAVRGHIQTESVQVGRAMQHLGALFLELGRAILTLRMGQSPAESLVNAGPAVYISPSGPNPIMVQPFPLQTSSLFGSPATQPNSGIMLPVGLGDAPRNVNIHIHAGTSLAGLPSGAFRPNTGDAIRGENRSGNPGDSGPGRMFPVRSVIATTIPPRFPLDSSQVRNIIPTHPRPEQNNQNSAFPAQGSFVVVNDVVQPSAGSAIVLPSTGEASIPTLMAEINAQISHLLHDTRGENPVPPGQPESSNLQGPPTASESDDVSGNPNQQSECQQYKKDGETSSFTSKEASAANLVGESSCPCEKNELPSASENVLGDASRSSQSHEHTEGVKSVPLGLGLGALQPRVRRGRRGTSEGKITDGKSSSPSVNQTQQAISSGQQVLQSLVARGSNARRDENRSSSGQLPPVSGQIVSTMPLASQGSSGQFDAASAMSQVLNSPALSGLLAGVSEQAGIGSPDGLRSMLQQFTSNPSMRNTLDQITQQIGGQDLGNMFSGTGRGQAGGMDFSSMIQQMMPIVSQALTGGSPFPEPSRGREPISAQQNMSNVTGPIRDVPTNQNLQIDLQQAAGTIERQSPPAEVFRSVVETAARLDDEGDFSEEFVDEIYSNPDLVNEFMEILYRDLRRRLQENSGSDGE